MAEPLAKSQAAIGLFNSEEAANSTTSPLYLHLLRDSQGPYLQAIPLNRLNHYLRLAGYGPAVMRQIVEYLYANREALFPDPLNHHYLKTKLAQKVLSYSIKHPKLNSEPFEIFTALHEHLHSFEELLVRAITHQDRVQLQRLFEQATPAKNLLIINFVKTNTALYGLLDETLFEPVDRKSVLPLEEVQSENESEESILRPINETPPGPLNFSQNQELHLSLISTLCELASDDQSISYTPIAIANKIVSLLVHPIYPSANNGKIFKIIQQEKHAKVETIIWDILTQKELLSPEPSKNISEELKAKYAKILNLFVMNYAPANLPKLAKVFDTIYTTDRNNGFEGLFSLLSAEAKNQLNRRNTEGYLITDYIGDTLQLDEAAFELMQDKLINLIVGPAPT